MTDLIFGVLTLALIVALCWYIRESNKEKAKLINALIAKNPEQLRDLTMADKVEKIKVPQPQQSDVVITSEAMDQEAFEKQIHEELQ